MNERVVKMRFLFFLKELDVISGSTYELAWDGVFIR